MPGQHYAGTPAARVTPPALPEPPEPPPPPPPHSCARAPRSQLARAGAAPQLRWPAHPALLVARDLYRSIRHGPQHVAGAPAGPWAALAPHAAHGAQPAAPAAACCAAARRVLLDAAAVIGATMGLELPAALPGAERCVPAPAAPAAPDAGGGAVRGHAGSGGAAGVARAKPADRRPQPPPAVHAIDELADGARRGPARRASGGAQPPAGRQLAGCRSALLRPRGASPPPNAAQTTGPPAPAPPPGSAPGHRDAARRVLPNARRAQGGDARTLQGGDGCWASAD